MFNVNLNYNGCNDDENILIAELIHKKNEMKASGIPSPELDALLEAVSGKNVSAKPTGKLKPVGKVFGLFQGIIGRIKLFIPAGRAQSKLM